METGLEIEGEPELYNLLSDIGEENNLASQEPERLKEMHDLLKDARTEHREFPLETRELAKLKRKKQ